MNKRYNQNFKNYLNEKITAAIIKKKDTICLYICICINIYSIKTI